MVQTPRKILAFSLVWLVGVVQLPALPQARVDGEEQARAMAALLHQGQHNWIQAQGQVDGDIHLWRAWKLAPGKSFDDYLAQLQYSDRGWQVQRHTRDRTLATIEVIQTYGARIWQRSQQLEMRRVAPNAAMIQQSGGDDWLTEGVVWGVPFASGTVIVAALRFHDAPDGAPGRHIFQQPMETVEQNVPFAKQILVRLQAFLP